MQPDRKWPHIERLAYLATFLAVMTWLMWAFGVSVAAWVLGGLSAVALFALGALFTLFLARRVMELSADLLHEQAGAAAGGHKALQEMYRAEREQAKVVGRGLQLEARQTSTDGPQGASWEVLAQQEAEGQRGAYGPVYVD